jgi:hypothetical protein
MLKFLAAFDEVPWAPPSMDVAARVLGYTAYNATGYPRILLGLLEQELVVYVHLCNDLTHCIRIIAWNSSTDAFHLSV